MDARYSEALEDHLTWVRTLDDLASHVRANRRHHTDIDPAPVEDMRTMVIEGGTYFWTPAIVDLINEGAASLDHAWPVVEETLLPPTRHGFCRLAKPIPIACIEHEGQEACMTLERIVWGTYRWQHEVETTNQALLHTKREDLAGIVIGIFQVQATKEFAVGGIPFVVGEPLEVAASRPFLQFFGGWSENANLGLMLLSLFGAASRFMAEPLVSVSHHWPNRVTRRRVERSEYQHEPLVRVIELRRREYQSHDSDDHRDVEWSCQWIVRGHWHRYRTKDGLQPRWVAPYVKGPEDRPLKKPRAEVFAVVR